MRDLNIIDCEPAELAEGPCWDGESGQLYWVDILREKIHCLNVEAGEVKTIDAGQKVGAFALRRSGGVVLAAERGFYLLDPETGKQVQLADPEAHLPDNRFNDGKCDAAGRFWAGTMSMSGAKEAGSLYCLEPDFTVRKVLEHVSVSNGITWSPDNGIMYYIDSPTKQVMAFDYRLETGEIGNARVAIRIPEGQGVPDGMTADAEGMLWIAQWGGGKVSRWNPATGALLDEIRLPVSQPSSCAFGGVDLDRLYITSAREDLSARQIAAEPLAGSVFYTDLGIKGMPMHKFGG